MRVIVIASVRTALPTPKSSINVDAFACLCRPKRVKEIGDSPSLLTSSKSEANTLLTSIAMSKLSDLLNPVLGTPPRGEVSVVAADVQESSEPFVAHPVIGENHPELVSDSAVYQQVNPNTVSATPQGSVTPDDVSAGFSLTFTFGKSSHVQ